MAGKKKILGLCAAVAAVAILIILLLRGCGGIRVAAPTEPSEAALTTSAAEETTAATEETEATVETTEATEETTEPTEETEPEETQGSTGSDTPGGYNPDFGTDDDEDEDEDKEEEPFAAPAAGEQTNPYVEKLDAVPGEINTVLIPLEGTIYYEIHGAANSVLTLENPDATILYGETTCKPDESGVITLPIGDSTEPITIQLSSAAAAEAPYLLRFLGPAGSESNPEVLEAIEQIPVELAEGDDDGHYYIWTPTQTGELTLAPQAEGYVITVTVGETVISSTDSEDGSLTFEVEKDQDVIIHVIAESAEEGVYPAVTDTITGTLGEKGTLLNPYVRYLTELPVEIPTVEISVDSYRVYDIFGASEAVLTIADANAVVVYNSVTFTPDENGILTIAFDILEPETAARLAISCSGEEAKTFTMHFAYPEGSEKNPIVLETLDPRTLSLAGGDDMVRWCSWTAEKPGTVTVQIDSVDPETVVCGIGLTGADSAEAAAEAPEATASMQVEAGQTVLIRLETAADESGVYPAADVTISGSFELKPGIEENPIALNVPEDSITAAAGESLHCTVQAPGMTMTLTGENVSITFDGAEYPAEGGQIRIPLGDSETAAFVVTNLAETEATYNLYFEYPLGSEENPAALVLGDNTAVPDESGEYWFAWTAQTGGQLTIAAAEETAWTHTIKNLTSAAEALAGSEASRITEVAAGDELRILVEGEAEEISFSASFYDPTLGTEVNPIWLEMPADEITLAPGETVYYRAAAAGADMTLQGTAVCVTMGEETFTLEEGILTFRCKAEEDAAEVVFAFANVGEEEGTFQVSFVYPVGSVQNPAPLILGENTAAVEAGSEGYYYSWMAEIGGELTISAPEGTAWAYRITNLTDETALPAEGSGRSETVAVSAGDELLIRITAVDPEDPEARPGGEVAFAASFVDPTLGTEQNPILLNIPQDTVTVPAGETVYYQARVSGMIMTLTGEQVKVSHNGIDYAADAGKAVLTCSGTGAFGMPVFAVTNTGKTEAAYAVSFAWLEGHRENPLELEPGECTCTVEAGGEGCFYTWTAEEDGVLTITMAEDAAWMACLSNLTTEAYGDIQTSGDEAPDLTITVKAGDTVQIQINTYDPAAPNTAPAGTVEFIVSFAKTEN